MAKFVPPGFDAEAVKAGIYKAMGFGEPTRTDDKATFFFPKTRGVATGVAVDSDGVPFDPTAAVAGGTTKAKLQVPCVVDYYDATGQVIHAGEITVSRVVLTLMDEDYQKVKGFAYVVCGGDKYLYSKTQPPVALGSIDFWTVHCVAEDER